MLQKVDLFKTRKFDDPTDKVINSYQEYVIYKF